jgi:DNA polymerase III epsilon subunit-like protein
MTAAVLFADTETTGLPKDYKASVTDVANWPRMVQLAWLVQGMGGSTTFKKRSLIIKPEGFVIPAEASAIHGITQERAMDEGVNLADAMEEFDADLVALPLAVCHNAPFDRAITGAERVRLGRPWGFTTAFKCTMAEGTNMCRLPGPRGFKWPTLQELYTFLFGKGFEGAHDALVDVEACARCYWEIQRRKNADPRGVAAVPA